MPEPTMHAVPEGAVIITPAQMYNEIQETRRSVDRLTSTIDPAMLDMRHDLADFGARLTALDVRQAKDANRITVLETKLVAAWAMLGLLTAAVGIVAAFFGK